MNLCHLHVHSVYSPMRGLAGLEFLCERAGKFGHQSLALTDTNGFYGIPHFVTLAREAGVKPIIGCELVLDDLRGVILCRNQTGFEKTCSLLSELHQSAIKKKRGLELLSYINEHIVFFTDDKEALLSLKESFNSSQLYFELTKGLSTFKDIQWLKENNIKPLATCRVHMERRGEDFYYRLIRAIDENCTLEEVDIKKTHSSSCYFPNDREFKGWFELIPEAIANTEAVARLCRSDWFGSDLIFPLYKGMSLEEGSLHLRQKCLERLEWRYPAAQPELLNKVQERLTYELSIIESKHFSNYFLVVDDFVRQSGINCGRGSGAASIVCYLLGITHVDPIKHNLFFERFLNEKRVDPPDIDIDFPWDERDDVLDYVFEKYRGRAAMGAKSKP